MNQTQRRVRVTGIATVMIAAFLLTSCAAGGSPGAGGDEHVSITLNATGGSMSDGIKASMVDPFTSETGIEVAMTAPNDLAKMKLMAESGNVDWDVVTADPTFSMRYCDQYVEKLDFDIIDTSNLDPALVSECTVPMVTPAFVLVYNTEKYGANPPTSWADFFDTTAFPGSRGIADWVDSGGLEAAMAATGATGADAADIDVDQAFAQLDRIKADTVFWGSSAEMQEAFENGRIDMAIGFMGRAWAAMDQGAPYQAVWNQAIYYYDALMVVKGTKHRKEAMEFIDYALQAGPQAKLTELTVYPGANLESKPQLQGSQLAFAPQDKDTAIIRDYTWWTEHLDEVTARWTSWKVG